MDEYLTEDDTPSYKSRLNHFSKDDRPRNFQISGGRSLQDSLIEQLGFKNLNQRQKTIAEFIIGSIDNDGYLRRDLQSLSDDIAFTLGIEVGIDELERLLTIIQHLEPVGVGARDLRESLLLQLNSQPLDSEAKRLAYSILENYFDEFVKKHYERMLSRLGVTEEQFRAAVQEIQHLSPKPGNLFTEDSDSAPYIIPDFILDYRDGRFDLQLNSYNIPELKINRHYMDVIRQMQGKSDSRMSEQEREAVQFVKSKIDAAKWFMSAIKQRHDTLMRTMQTILDYQQEYFKDGDRSNLKPMILKDIADLTGLDVSTISRVANSKYVQTSFGIILLKSLFSEAMQTTSGEEVSSYEIKNLLEKCIEEENKRRPLTDEQLMNILNDKGYCIARRTVAKYREMLGIPVARLRKEI
jgi:RNA polymerase sigma-54 factor